MGQSGAGCRRGAGCGPPGPADVIVGIETDRGTWVQTLLASDYQVYAINPRQVAPFKERYGTSGAKSGGGRHLLATTADS